MKPCLLTEGLKLLTPTTGGMLLASLIRDFFVLQVGGNLYFYSAVNPTSKSCIFWAYPVTYDFSVFASSTSDLVNNEPCQFTSGPRLFICYSSLY